MSEYQYYDLAAIDRPLTPEQQAELRSRSSRATITPGSFINEYNWGDLKGDPMEWVRRYFDAHVYSANWGSCRFLLRVPAGSVDKAMLDACVQPPAGGRPATYCDTFGVTFIDGHCLLDWSFNDDSGEYERFWSQADGPGWMSRLLPLRDEVLRGDARPIYLGRLARVCSEQLGEDDLEPPLPAGLAALTPAQAALAEFLGLDPDWLSAAAAASTPESELVKPEYDAWLADQPEQSLRDSMRLLLEGRGQEAERKVRLAFLAWQADRRPENTLATRRSVAEIAVGVATARKLRLERERQARAVAEAKREAERAAHLAAPAADPQMVWGEIDGLLNRGSGAAYDQALHLTQELSEALSHTGRGSEFWSGLVTLLAKQGTRRAWMTRLEKAGLWWMPKP
jgi:hypothetical protein